MKILTTEEKEILKEYSEGNEYLYDALCTCWENEIETYACCEGHPLEMPYLGIILNKKNLPYIKNIVGILQDVKDISISSGIRGRESESSGIPPDEECRSLLIYGSGSNRCEMFYKIKQAILSSLTFNQKKIKESRAKQFIQNLEGLVAMSYDEIMQNISDGVGIGTTFSNNSEELIEYYFSINNSINKIRNILEKLFPFIKKINENKIYSKMQHSYTPILQIDNEEKDNNKFSSQVITFEYALAHIDAQVMTREIISGRYGQDKGLLKPIKIPESFVGFKAKTIKDVKRIYQGPKNPAITSKNITEYIEEPCISVFLKLQKLGIQTNWSSANKSNIGKERSAFISIVPETLSNENLDIFKKLGLKHENDGYKLEVKIELTDTVQDVSAQFLKLCEDFVEQPVLYGHQSQTEYLNSYCKHNSAHIAEISNIDENYINDHLSYLLTNFPEYISFDGENYTCIDMPDEVFQREILDRELSRKIISQEPSICIDGVVWESKELYDINEHNIRKTDQSKKNNLFKHSVRVGSLDNKDMLPVGNSILNNPGTNEVTPERE